MEALFTILLQAGFLLYSTAMAVENALSVILSEWDDIEPLLTVSELTTLASISRETLRGGGSARAAVVFQIISAALPAGHTAQWRCF